MSKKKGGKKKGGKKPKVVVARDPFPIRLARELAAALLLDRPVGDCVSYTRIAMLSAAEFEDRFTGDPGTTENLWILDSLVAGFVMVESGEPPESIDMNVIRPTVRLAMFKAETT